MHAARREKTPSITRRRSAALAAAAIACAVTFGIASAAARAKSGLPTDRENIQGRQDIAFLPKPLKERLVTLARRPHTYPAMRAFAEADKPSQLFEYYLLDASAIEPRPRLESRRKCRRVVAKFDMPFSLIPL